MHHPTLRWRSVARVSRRTELPSFSLCLLHRPVCAAAGLHIPNPALVLSPRRPVLRGPSTAERFGLALCSGCKKREVSEGGREGGTFSAAAFVGLIRGGGAFFRKNARFKVEPRQAPSRPARPAESVEEK